MHCQKHLFDLPEDITYLNGAYMSPQLLSVTEIGLQAVTKKSRPYGIKDTDFFTERAVLKKKFAQLIDAPDYKNIAIIPSVSYGIANAANNIVLDKGDEILLIDEQFPSNFYTWQEIAVKNEATLRMIKPPANNTARGQQWNQNILDTISKKTAVVAMAQVHWTDGTLFDLKAIRARTKSVAAALIIDGTQSIGAYPFSIEEIQPDALICGGYKWLLGPYSLGMAYYSDSFNHGAPIEYNWMNRHDSQNFGQLTRYEQRFQEKAARYTVGESSNFILVPMLIKAIEQLLTWNPKDIQEYCKEISENAIQELRSLGCFIEADRYRSQHLFGVYLPEHIEVEKLKKTLEKEQIFVSYRGNAVRISPNVYNTAKDLDKLVKAIKEIT